MMKHGITEYAKNDFNTNIDGRPLTFPFDESINKESTSKESI